MHGLLPALLWAVPAAQQPTPQEEEFFAAVRRSDVAAVKSLLEKGVNVNARFRYGTTALFPACDRGSVEIVRLLLERGAEVNVRDTFYGASPLAWAATKGHAEIVRLLLEKGAQGIDAALMAAVNGGHLETVRVVLARGELRPTTLSAALSSATRAQRTEIAGLLQAAGAAPPPKADAVVEEETLRRYAGIYRSEAGAELVFFFRDGKLFGGPPGQNPLPMNALNNTTFRPGEKDEITLAFRLEGDTVTGVTLSQGDRETTYKRVEDRKE
jgi:hypothetical protein